MQRYGLTPRIALQHALQSAQDYSDRTRAAAGGAGRRLEFWISHWSSSIAMTVPVNHIFSAGQNTSIVSPTCLRCALSFCCASLPPPRSFYCAPVRSRRRCGTGEPSPGANVVGASPVPVQMWQG